MADIVLVIDYEKDETSGVVNIKRVLPRGPSQSVHVPTWPAEGIGKGM